jgi:hypothetical protein
VRGCLAAGGALFLLALLSLSPRQAHAAWSTDEIQRALERKWDGGVTRDLPSAQGCYRAALAAAASKNDAEAIRLLEAASQFDPYFPDAHFTMARLVAFRQAAHVFALKLTDSRELCRRLAAAGHLAAAHLALGGLATGGFATGGFATGGLASGGFAADGWPVAMSAD